jgi:carbon-monoxide dehydrogenase medium subunit
MKLRLAAPPALVDIGRIPELRGISRSGDTIRIGALTTHAEIAASAEVQKSAAALSEAAGLVGDPAVRSRGTIGGNIAHADPGSDLPTVLVALDARIVAIGPAGERTIPADGFFTGIMSTLLADNEVVTAIVVPSSARGQGSAYVKFSHPASRYAVIGVSASVTVAGNACSAARVALGGLLPHASRAHAVEKALTGKPLDTSAIANAAAQVGADLGGDVTGDIFASASYRAAVAPVYVKRAIAAAAARAGLA